MEKPIFKPHFRAEIVPDQGVLLLSESGHHVLTGKLFQLVAPLVDGKRSPDDIVDSLAGELQAAEVYYALLMLEKKGYLLEAGATNHLTAFWTVNGIDPGDAAERLNRLGVSVAALGDVSTGPLVSILKGQGIQSVDDGHVRLVLTDDYLRADLEECNDEALKHKRPWMLMKPVGIEIFIGPLFIPDTTGCWRCLRDRHVLNREVDQFIMDKNGLREPSPPPAIHTPATVQVAYNIAATELAKWIAVGTNAQIEGAVLSVDTRTWQTRRYSLTRLGHCPSCGKSLHIRNESVPVRLRERKATFTQDGGYRTVSPEETLKRFDHLISPVTGVVKFLAREQVLDGMVHVYLAGHNFALRSENLAFLRKGLRAMSAGKGTSEVQAKASGLCEAIERYSGLFQGYEARIASNLTQLGERGIHPNECMLYSQRQYQNREKTNVANSKFNFVPVPLEDAPLELEWSPVWSLTYEMFKYLPTQYLYYHYVYPDGRREPVYCHVCSNGNASGNSLEEAVLQGFFELVERDSVALWWYNMLKKPAVDLMSFDEPYFPDLVSCYGRMNRQIWVLDITADLGMPAFAAVSAKRGQQQERLIFGFGCHLDARLAVQRALTEMNQSLSMVQRVFDEERTANPDFGDNEAVKWWKIATSKNQPYVAPDKDLPLRCSKDYQEQCSKNLLENIMLCRKIVEERGMEMLVLDQTRPDIGVSVAKVIVPGLRHFWARFAPGRLYDVPVQMGWLDKPLKEEELNPIAMFL